MIKYFIRFFFLFLLIIVPLGVLAEQPTALEKALEEKTKKLQEIHTQLQATQQSLFETEGKKRTLNSELQKIGKEIKQLNLGIQSSQLTIEKLTLEKGSLENDITDIRDQIGAKKKIIANLLRRLQEKDRETVLVTLLKQESLSENLSEIQNFAALNNNLNETITDLKLLDSQLNEKLGATTNKKRAVEVEHRTLTVRKTITADKEQERKQLLTQTKDQEKLFQQQILELEKKQLAIADEIEEIEAKLRLQSDPTKLPTARPGVLLWPAQGRLSQNWGATDFARSKKGYRGHWHNGIDIAAPIGTVIIAAEQGIVVAVGDQDRYCRRAAYGKFVVIRHGNNLTTLYTHLSQYIVSAGAIVNKGDIIGYMGRTGYATGPHLHFTVYDSKTFSMRSSNSCGPMPTGGDLNPLRYL